MAEGSQTGANMWLDTESRVCVTWEPGCSFLNPSSIHVSPLGGLAPL